ncbi:MAG: hypothetical protein M3R52_09000 [Acidobacteriota bacterium]|nr:hypothetical protein [Acidobacteriota bacterium]
MTKQTQGAAAPEPSKSEPTKRELERQMQRTRESLAETVGEIKETVEQEYQSVRKTVSGVLDYREEFKNEPLVWSLGALSAGFARGYTVGYAHKNTKGGKQSQLAAFAGSMVDELSTMGQGLVIPALSGKIRELFGFDFAGLLAELGEPKKIGGKGRKKKTPGKGRTVKGDPKKNGQKRTSRKL